MKRSGIFALFILAAVSLCGCARMDAAAVQLGLKESPYYHLGDTWWDHGGIEEYYFNQIPSELNEIYRELYERLRNHEDEAELYARVTTEQFWDAYYSVINDHPEFFWIGSNIQVSESPWDGKVVSYKVETTVPAAEREAMRIRLEAAADECIAQIPEDAGTYERIRSVYTWLIDTTDYDSYAAQSQNIQSALLGHASVCAGYSRAFQYILHRMGMFCTYVTGTIVTGGEHAWNIVRIDDQYYNVDVTWGDPVFAGMEEGEPVRDILYTYLCCTDADLRKTHMPDELVPLPSCTDTGYDYYRLTGQYYEVFDYDTVYQALMNSVWEERSQITLKFGSREAFDSAVYEFFSNGMLHDAAQYLMDIYGVDSYSYSYSTEEMFNLITIYWR